VSLSPLPVLDLDLHDAPLRRLGAQADLSYHAAPVAGIFNPPAATGMSFWSVNPYVGCAFGCAYCYARDTHRWTLERAGDVGAKIAESMPPWLAFERRVLVKENAAVRVREALRSSRAPRAGDVLVIGSATDPYQPAERTYQVTRGVLAALQPVRGVRLTIITKSPLVTRDVALLLDLAKRNTVAVHITITTIDRELARRIEPRAPTPESRLRAVSRLATAGIDVRVNCMPVMPGITDDRRALAELVRRVAEAGATEFAACALRLRSASRRRYLPFVREAFPELAERYERTYRNSVYAHQTYRDGLSEYVQSLCRRHGLAVSTMRYQDGHRGASQAAVAGAPTEAVAAGPDGAVQLDWLGP